MLDEDKQDATNDGASPVTPTDSPAADSGDTGSTPPAVKKTTRKRTTKKVASAPAAETAPEAPAPAADVAVTSPAATPVVTKTTRKRTTKKAAPAAEAAPADATAETPAAESAEEPAKKAAAKKTAAKKTVAKKTTAKKTTAKKATAKTAETEPAADQADDAAEATSASGAPVPLFQAPTTTAAPRRRTAKKAQPAPDTEADAEPTADTSGGADTSSEISADGEGDGETDGEGAGRRRRRRGGRRRRKPTDGESDSAADDSSDTDTDTDAAKADKPAKSGRSGQSGQSGRTGPAKQSGQSGVCESDSDGTTRRRRRRRRAGDDDGDGGGDDPANTVTRVRSRRSAEDEITAVSGSTRLEAKKQRRREGREAGRRRAPIVSEAEFLARRESVNRVMAVRQRDDVTQIGVLEDNVLVEHYVARESQTSLIGNVYLGRVQNVLPSMEAAFIDIGKGRNAVLYAGEVNWSSLGHKDGQPRKIESVLSSGQPILVQVTKDPIGHKGARLTSQVSLAGRFLVYVPDGTTSGISRKLPDTERNRLKTLLKEIVPDTAGVIVRTAAEGASEEELTQDVERLKARWEDIEKKSKGQAPQLLYGEPDLTLKVVRDLFTEDFAKLVIEGDEAWETVQGYVQHVAPDLEERLERYTPTKGQDVFSAFRIDEQIKKGLDRKVWLPSGGSLVIDRTEAMTVVDVNTGKFTGSGGNLEETVTKNNLEAAEEIVRQLRLRDIGGIIVVDFIDMVLESNRDLVLRRLVECLGRDRTRHQVAEVTSLGLVQMTRKRIGVGLLESFSHDCPTCHGRGVVVEDTPVEPRGAEEEGRRTGRRTRGRGKGDQDGTDNGNGNGQDAKAGTPSPKDIAAMPRHEHVEQDDDVDEVGDDVASAEVADRAPEMTAEAPPVAEPETGETTDAVTETEAEAAPEEPTAPPEPPRVVTRTRRRSASRPAGPPSAVEPGAVEPGGVEPGGVEPSTTEPNDAEPDASGDSAEAADAADPGVEGGTALHVPVKRKRSRKR
jgi:ribonuclease E